jgi:hypothetical protein
MIFPSDNLGTSSKPWAREVTKQLSNIIDTTVSNEINNAARDNQLNSSIIAASAAATAAAEAAANAKAAIDGLGSLDEATSTFKINASNLTAGTLDASVVNVTNLNADNIESGTITGLTLQTASVGGVKISNDTNSVSFRNGSTTVGHILPFASNGVIIHYGPTPNADAGAFPQMYVGSGNVSMAANNQNFIGISSSGVVVNGEARFYSKIFIPGASYNSSASANMRKSTSNDEILYTAQSSIRYKKDVVDLIGVEELNPKKLLDLPVRAFRYKDGYLTNPLDSRYEKLMPGFIAEEVEQYYPLAAEYQDDTTIIDNWNERMIIPGMLALIQDLYKEIAILKGA